MKNKKDFSLRPKAAALSGTSIYLVEGLAFILTDCLNVNTHSHNALQITLSTNGRLLQCLTLEGLVEGEIILVPPLASHAFKEEAGIVLVILIDDEFVVSETLTEPHIKSLETTDFLELKTFLGLGADLTEISNAFHQTKFLKKFMKPAIDNRIKKLITQVKEDDAFLPTAENAAQFCHLSESRFLHLFKQELGLPFRKYLQWTKLKRALKYLKMGHSLTQVAHMAGFSDSAHLSRFFKDSFGLTPSEVVHNSKFIQAK